MQTKNISTGETPELVFELRRNLKLVGVEGATELGLSTRDDAQLDVQQHAGKVIVHCDKDLEVTVPVNATLRIPLVRGNATLSKLQGDVDIDRIRGNLTLVDVNTVQINRVDGNLTAEDLGSAFSCNGVGGQGIIRGAICPIELNVGGNLEMSDVSGIIRGSAGGSVTLHARAEEGDTAVNISLNAGGNVNFDIPSSGQLTLSANAGGNVNGHLGEGVSAQISTTDSSGPKHFTLGEKSDTSGVVQLNAGGRVHLTTHGTTHFADGAHAKHDHHDSHGFNPFMWEGSEPRTIKLGSKRIVRFEVGISLKLEGYEGDEVIVERGGNVQDVDGEIHVEAGMDCRARVPNNTAIFAEVGVDAQVRDFEGALNIESGASARVKNFVGVAHIEAGAEAKVDFVPTGDSHIEAGADARCWVPADANVTVNLEDMRGQRTQVFGDGAIKMSVTAGMNAKAYDTGGEEDEGINFKFDSERGFVANISPDIEKQILEFTSEMTTAATRLSEGVSTIPMPDWLKGEVNDMHRRVEEATRRAQERIARRIESATRRAERKAEKTGKRTVQVRGDFDIDLPFFKRKVEFNTEIPRPPEPPRPPQPPAAPEPPEPPLPFAAKPKKASEPVGNEERMAILRMLEQKKITAEQAAQLLAAMGE